MPRMRIETEAPAPQTKTKTVVESSAPQPAEELAAVAEATSQDVLPDPPVVRSKPTLHVDPAPELPADTQVDEAPVAQPAAKASTSATAKKATAKKPAGKSAANKKATNSSTPKKSVDMSQGASDSAAYYEELQERQMTAAERIAGAPKSAASWVSRTFPGHEHAFYGGCIALILALLVFAIGPLKVLFIVVLVVVGIAVGQMFDGNPVIVRAIRELFEGDRGQL